MLIAENDIYAIIGKRVHAARERAQLTQSELASRIGFSRASISNIESGRQKIQVHVLWSLANALNVTAQDLLPAIEADNSEHRPIDLGQLDEFDPSERDWILRVLTGRNAEANS